MSSGLRAPCRTAIIDGVTGDPSDVQAHITTFWSSVAAGYETQPVPATWLWPRHPSATA